MRKLSFLFVSAALLLNGCTTSPVSGQSIFTGFVDSGQENQIGAGEHQTILKQYNGVADNKDLDAFVQKIGAKLTPYAERKDVTFTFTVLNDDIVNAFAVPGGYIYITRGLLNLAQNEAQVAAVLGHEMGHINARHSAQQMSQTMVANIGLQALGIAVGNDLATQAGSLGADLYIKKYSRAHELEADQLAVKYLAAAGYDPYANTKFLAMLEEYTSLQQRMSGSAAGNDLASFFATHPPTMERVNRARILAEQAPKVANPIINRDEYLRAIDGTVYGDSAEQGFARGREFIHPGLKIKFEVPEGFKIQNSAEQVVAQNASGASIIFDMKEGNNDDPVQFISRIWAPNTALSGQEKIDVNGMPGAIAATQMNTSSGTRDARIMAISAGKNQFYRFVFLAPTGQMERYSTEFRRMTYTLSKLSARDMELASPNRVRLIKVKEGDTIKSLAAQMPVTDYAVERFCLLNGLQPTDSLEVGRTIKTIMTF
jgi:predicted Zn-dependent protease